MSHYRKIRRSVDLSTLPPQTRTWLMEKRRQEIDLERRLKTQVQRAKSEGRCTAFIMPKPGVETMYRSEPPTPGRLCGEEAVHRGYCMGHFITHGLHLMDRKGGRAGRGVTSRPFAAYQFPCGRLSAIQEDLMSDLERLPMNTPREECWERLNAEDPSNPLPQLTDRKRLNKP